MSATQSPKQSTRTDLLRQEERLAEMIQQIQQSTQQNDLSLASDQIQLHLENAFRELEAIQQMTVPNSGTAPETSAGEQDTAGKEKEQAAEKNHPSAKEADFRLNTAKSGFSSSFTKTLIEYLLKESPALLYALEATPPYQAIYLSENLLAMTGYTPNESMQVSDFWESRIHPEDMTTVMEIFPQLFQQGNCVFEYRFRFKDGSYHWLYDQLRLMHDTAGRVNGIMGCRIDITEKKNAEAQTALLLRETQTMNEELRASEEELIQTLDKTLELNEQLASSEQFSQKIISSVNEGVVVFDTNLRCIVWNTFLEQKSGLSASEVFGKHVFELFPFIKTNGLLQMMERALLGETVEFSDTHIPMPAPEGAWITGTYSPLRNIQNEIVGVINTTTSITQRKRMEVEKSRLLLETQALNENLKISEQKLQEAQKIARLGTWEFDMKRWEMEWSAELFRFFGLDPAGEQPSFDECLEMIAPEFRERTQQIIAQASRSGCDFELEIKVLPRDTAFRWNNCLGKAIFNEAGEVVKLLGVSYDITERKVADEQIRQLLRDSQDLNNRLLAGEEALRESLVNTLALNDRIQQSEQRWQYALEGSGDGVWDWNLQTNAVFFSNRFKEFLGYRKEDKINDLNQWTLKLHPEDKDRVFEALNKHIKGETETYQAEYRALGKNNQYRWLLGRGKVLEKDKNGKAIRMIGTITDTTERKEIEEKLKQQNVDLQKINAELDNFVYRTSHDLRSPLCSLLGLINISRIETDDNQKTLYLNLMEKSVTKLDTFISDIINHSRNARLALTQEEIPLPTMLEETLNGLRFLENFSSIEKIIEVNQAAPFVSDIYRLKIICNNLLSNAIKYRSPADSTAQIRIIAQVTKERALFEFQDNGVGIPQESLEKIFTMFYRATATSNGSGLGLYIVKEVVQTLQGQISVQSELGKGTTFTVELPNAL